MKWDYLYLMLYFYIFRLFLKQLQLPQTKNLTDKTRMHNLLSVEKFEKPDGDSCMQTLGIWKGMTSHS